MFSKMNKRGSDIPSILFAITIIFSVGIIIVLFSNSSLQIYGEMKETLNNVESIDSTQTNQTLTQIETYESSMWDYFFLFILIGYVLVLMVLSFSTQINAFFYFIFGIVAMFGLFLGVALSNTWEKFAETEVLTGTIQRFPITDTILNNFFPLFIVVLFVSLMVMLFGKRFLGNSQDGGLR